VEQTFYVPLEREPVMVRFDPDGWLLKTLKFERSSKMLRYQLAHDPDVLGRIEAAEELGKQGDEESVKALSQSLLNDAFWGVRIAAAQALAEVGSAQAQELLLQALQKLDARQFSRVRAAIADALGRYSQPTQPELAQRSAAALASLLEAGDISYLVEGAAARSLGKTRTSDAVERLLKGIDSPSWMHTVQASIFAGLAATGEDRVVEIITPYLTDATRHPTLRIAAARGLNALAHNRHLYSEEARQRAVTALIEAVEHDSWPPVRAAAARALALLGEKRAIGPLESVASRELETAVQRAMREAVHSLRFSDKTDEQLKQLRKDLDEVREENRKLKEQLGALEARVK